MGWPAPTAMLVFLALPKQRQIVPSEEVFQAASGSVLPQGLRLRCWVLLGSEHIFLFLFLSIHPLVSLAPAVLLCQTSGASSNQGDLNQVFW